jgi:hypothetical protein
MNEILDIEQEGYGFDDIAVDQWNPGDPSDDGPESADEL